MSQMISLMISCLSILLIFFQERYRTQNPADEGVCSRIYQVLRQVKYAEQTQVVIQCTLMLDYYEVCSLKGGGTCANSAQGCPHVPV